MTGMEQGRGKRLYDVFIRRYYEADPLVRKQYDHCPLAWDELPLWCKYVYIDTAEEVGPGM